MKIKINENISVLVKNSEEMSSEEFLGLAGMLEKSINKLSANVKMGFKRTREKRDWKAIIPEIRKIKTTKELFSWCDAAGIPKSTIYNKWLKVRQ